MDIVDCPNSFDIESFRVMGFYAKEYAYVLQEHPARGVLKFPVRLN